MNFQNQAILSLGSNTGNRLENIMSCVSLIHKTIATVIKVSHVYESPSWGFKSGDFYNCALLVHTPHTAQHLLEAILEAERGAGRLRGEEAGYSARAIDIDIIAFNDEHITSDSLEVPHPRMGERLFVLLPLRDVAPGWIHPLLNQDIEALLNDTTDKSPCVPVAELQAPLERLNPQRFNYIAIEGNIGSGKTTLAGRISDDFNAKLVPERFADNPFLPKFYKDQARYAFSLEMAFLADRYHQLSDDLSQFDLFRDFVVSDYHIFKSLIFSKVTLNEDEYRLYRKLFDIIYKEMPRPGLYIYLYQHTATLLEHIKKRGRPYEQDIKAEYLDSINRGYFDYIRSQDGLNVLVVDVSGRDFVKNQQDYLWLLEQINMKT